ncbi:MAG TPA: hypothetical protein VKX39_05940 [Bryobacteraceae bacterium]|jgi:hypothetical protein|nr:hypothetical protein [Bryobacteraceae bacterium]
MGNVPAIQAILESQTQCKSFTRVTTMQFFRDEQSRTRVEQGELASIHDPVTGQSFTLNPAKKIAIPGMPKMPGVTLPKAPAIQGIALPQMPGMQIPQAPGGPPQPPQEIAHLGEKTIDGIKVSGKQLAFPVAGKPQSLVGEVWTSKDLKLPIHSTVTDPSTGCVMRTQMKNVQSGVKLDPGMFKVPADFKIALPAKPV